MSKGKTDLSALVRELDPELHHGQYVFCTIDRTRNLPLDKVLATFQEGEGLTVVLEKPLADRWELDQSAPMAWIKLKVHSSLEAVGLTAVISAALRSHQISCNIISAFYHDHLFVPYEQREAAMQALANLMKTAE